MMMEVPDQERPSKKPLRERITETVKELLDALEQVLIPSPPLVPVRARGPRRIVRR
jgi:hypothetical protein